MLNLRARSWLQHDKAMILDLCTYRFWLFGCAAKRVLFFAHLSQGSGARSGNQQGKMDRFPHTPRTPLNFASVPTLQKNLCVFPVTNRYDNTTRRAWRNAYVIYPPASYSLFRFIFR